MMTHNLMSWSETFDSKQKTQKAQKDNKTIFPKEIVENADFHKPLLKKTMTTHEWIKYDFGAALLGLFQRII